MNLKKILPYLGVFLKVNAFVLLLPAIPALYYHEQVTPFILASFASYLFGLVLSRMDRQDFTLGDAMLLSVVTLLSTSFFGSLVFLDYFQGPLLERMVDSFFESVSGYTTTGLSVISPVQIGGYPKSVLFLRALMQWTGGLGIIVLGMWLIQLPGLNVVKLYRSEVGSEKIHPTVSKTAKEIIKIYLLFTFSGIVLLWISGTGVYDAVYNIFASISTGGFWHNNGLVYTNTASEVITIVFMFLGSFAFLNHYLIFRGDFDKVGKNIEVKTLFLILFASIILFTLLFLDTGVGLPKSLDHAVFNVVSASTTTGYSSIDFSGLSGFGKFYTSILMFIGASMNSTGGGLKIIRFIVLVYSARWIVLKMIRPKTAVTPFKIGNDMVLEDFDVQLILTHSIAYLIILGLGVMVIASYGYDVADSIFLSSSAIGTVGLSTLEVHALPVAVKLFVTFEMLVGRLEIMPMLVLFGYILKKIF